MKKIFILILFAGIINAQDFVVKKTTGSVRVLKGTSEEIEEVKIGDKLNALDVLITENKSSVTLNRKGKSFFLKSNSALGLDRIKALSINDLLLALAMEEIRQIPKSKSGNTSKNTAVYGSKIKSKSVLSLKESDFGLKKLNGAKQLAENGFKESAIVVAKETYRNFPSTKSEASTRIYFADLLFNLNLLEEALDEYSEILELDLSKGMSDQLYIKIQDISSKLNRD